MTGIGVVDGHPNNEAIEGQVYAWMMNEPVGAESRWTLGRSIHVRLHRIASRATFTVQPHMEDRCMQQLSVLIGFQRALAVILYGM